MLVHPTAIIGEPPEHRGWSPGDPTYAPFVAVSSRIAAYVTIDAGLHAPTHIGARVWLMKHVHVGHDAVIDDDCEIAPHCSIGGHVMLGRGVRVGQGATFKPFVHVGDGARIGMGSVVIHDVPAGEVWAGNPARRITWHREPSLTALELEGWECYAAPAGSVWPPAD